MTRPYSGYIPENNYRLTRLEQLADLEGRLMGDYPPADLMELRGALIEMTRIVQGWMVEHQRNLDKEYRRNQDQVPA